MFSGSVIIEQLVIALLAGYLLGSVPFAFLAARLRGVDIFNTGSRTAGTANVFWNIGRRTGVLVFVGDVAKGAAAVAIAGLVGAPWPVALLAGGAAVLGHWKSVFSGFRGGDGMATLIGVAVALVPALTALSVLIGLAVMLLLRRSPLRSAWALSASFMAMLGVSQYYQIDRDLVMGLVALTMLVLSRSVVSRRRRTGSDSAPEEDEDAVLELDLGLELDLDMEPESEMGPAAQENH